MKSREFDDDDARAWNEAADITHDVRDTLAARGIGPAQAFLVGVQLAALSRVAMVGGGFPRELADIMLEGSLKMASQVTEELLLKKKGQGGDYS